MAGSLNKVQLIGRLGADPEVKQMVNGKLICLRKTVFRQNEKTKC